MPRDKKASHARVIEASRIEFREYGFHDASMRRIGQRAGMTAAGLYRHFSSKEAMFDALVGPAVEDLQHWLDEHTARAHAALLSGGEALWDESEIDMMRDLIYPRMEEYRLLLTCSAGSRYENFLHDLISGQQQKMEPALVLLRERGYPVRPLRSSELHMLLTAYCTALFEPVIHGYTLEEALRSLDAVEAFFLPGWKQLLGF